MNRFTTFVIGTVLCVLPLTQTLAKLNVGTEVPTKPITESFETEIMVIEAANCTYCELFRRNVLPIYQASAQHKSLSVKFVDINDTALAKLKLSEPVEIVPTVVVAKNGIEAGRIPGYSGIDDFSKSLDYLLSGNH